ncbi:efflux RND transporter periplasmic adaptor subunit [Hymenobacter humi]
MSERMHPIACFLRQAAVGLLLGLGLLSACQPRTSGSADQGSKPAAPPADGSAHQHAGSSSAGPAADTLTLDAGQQARAGLEIVVVTPRGLFSGQQVLGTVVSDETQTVVVSARAAGRLDHLYANTPGQPVRRGQPLYGLYSETLLADAQEYRRTLRERAEEPNVGAPSLSANAARKLRLQGVSAAQLAALASARQLPATLRFDSPASGYLAELLVREGQYVTQGTPLLRITNSATVWVEAQLYPTELTELRQLGRAAVELEAYPGQTFPAHLVDERPALAENSRITLVRLRVVNPAGQLRPGMMATVQLGSAARRGLTVPFTALYIGTMTTAWVQTAPTVFERRMIRTGRRAGSYVELLSGVHDGERVVSSGAYLLESERELRRGSGSMANMPM